MNKFGKAFAIAAACIGLVAGGAVPAMAADTTAATVAAAEATFERLEASANPEAAYGALTAAEREAFLDYYAPATEIETIEFTPLDATAELTAARGLTPTSEASVARAGGCWGSYAKRTVNNNFGMGLFDVYVEGRWCSNGSSITSTTFDRTWSTIGTIGWRDSGQIGSGKGVVNNQARIWGQRSMQFGTAGWDLIEHRTCVRLHGGPGGGTSAGTTCSIY